jgi:hypothetical protein
VISVRRFARAGRLRSLPELLRTLPWRQLVWFWVAILQCLFDVRVRDRRHAPQPVELALSVIVAGLIGVGYAVVLMPTRPAALAAMLVMHAFYVTVVPRLFPLLPATPDNRLLVDGKLDRHRRHRLQFLSSLHRCDRHALHARAEIALGRDIHRVLVLEIRRPVGDYEFFGWSVPSGDVGGDLVDLIETGAGWLG